MGETSKAKDRRIAERWFDRYAPSELPGIDIGCGDDPLCETFRQWDISKGDGDATLMEGVADESYCTVYASHVLEHLNDPITALQNWYRILKPGGHLIICVPHRDLYERKKELPSNWNGDHKTFWLTDRHELPCTRGIIPTIREAIPDAVIMTVKILDDGFSDPGPAIHSLGEYSIEAIVKKPNGG